MDDPEVEAEDLEWEYSDISVHDDDYEKDVEAWAALLECSAQPPEIGQDLEGEDLDISIHDDDYEKDVEADPEVAAEDLEGEDSDICIYDDDYEKDVEAWAALLECSEGPPSGEWEADGPSDDECEVVVTFCKRAEIMLHARYDCTAYPFVRAECETSSPLGRNAETCSECYCYICNKPAVECKDWVAPSVCHCNAHNKSQYWKDQWNFALTGGLAIFNLPLSEIDADVKRGGALLQQFMRDVSVAYSQYLRGQQDHLHCDECFYYMDLGYGPCSFPKKHTALAYRYEPVSQLVSDFLDRAAKENPKAEAIVLLGAAREIALHKKPAGRPPVMSYSLPPSKMVPWLMDRIVRQLLRLLILHDFPKPLQDKLICFYRSIPFPVHCYNFVESLHFFSWDHGLLTSVLKGQNLSGKRGRRGKKETLVEARLVIKARIERLEGDQRFRELVRYLKVVRCDELLWLKEQRDKIPFYLCKMGDLEEAAQAFYIFYPQASCSADRLLAAQFEVYLKVFRTGQVPPGNEPSNLAAPWPSAGKPLKLRSLIRWTLRLLYSNVGLFKDPKCWSVVIQMFSSLPFLDDKGCLIAATLEEPPQDFQETVFAESWLLLDSLANGRYQGVSLSEAFGEKTQLEASLLFATQAVRRLVLKESRSLSSFLEVVLSFGDNLWALKLLLGSLAPHEKALATVLGLTLNDLQCREAEMLEVLHHRGPQYVGRLLCLFLASSDQNMVPVGVAILGILQANLQQCPWAKQVGQYLEDPTHLPCIWPPEICSFVAAAGALP